MDESSFFSCHGWALQSCSSWVVTSDKPRNEIEFSCSVPMSTQESWQTANLFFFSLLEDSMYIGASLFRWGGSACFRGVAIKDR